jgi:hypothetical protein
MEILNKQKGEFKKLETEFSQLLKSSPGSESREPPQEDNDAGSSAADIGGDDPF